MGEYMQKNISRRAFVGGAATVGASAVMAANGLAQEKKVDVSFKKDFKAPDKCFMDQYYDGMLKIAEDIRATQVAGIAKAMEKAYELKSKGGNIYSHVLLGHFRHVHRKSGPAGPTLSPSPTGGSQRGRGFQGHEEG